MTARSTSPHGRILIIAGSDSGGGAGIQGDIKTVSALGGYAMTSVTAITVQNTLGVFNIHPIPDGIIAQQIDAVLSDLGADAIKTGMLHSARVIEVIAAQLDHHFFSSPPEGERDLPLQIRGGSSQPVEALPPTKTRCVLTPPRGGSYPVPLVVDPVMMAKGGTSLLASDAFHALKTTLIPRATIITPNLPEAEWLLGRSIGADDMEAAARDLLELGSRAVLLKGGHGIGPTLTDILVFSDAPVVTFSVPRQETRHTHGTGCSFASAIATGLAQKLPLVDAVARAHAYVQGAIARAPGFGAGNGPLGH